MRINAVASYVGAWIETVYSQRSVEEAKSHPMWVRGLKQNTRHLRKESKCVASYVGAWIETFLCLCVFCVVSVASYVGAWIETEPDC